MFNKDEQGERKYLAEVLKKLEASVKAIEKEIMDYSDNMVQSKRFAWENLGALDTVEVAAYKIAMNEESIFAELSLAERNQLRKLILSPYFGRIDFAAQGKAETPYYIGIHSYFDRDGDKELIIDWRAPLSSMFYDFETGRASYLAPEGERTGEVLLKRQYRIKNSKMEYMLESSLNIGDDVLQRELSRTSDEKMKNIVATIQKEQNQIIRNESAKALIIQGAAGSGKTSIALHRVAFLLYRHKHTLKSSDVLVLSPNKVFGSYISNVLPELGEENVPQITCEGLAAQFLGRTRKFQTFAEQVADLLTSTDEAKLERIRYKASIEFVRELQGFFKECEDTGFAPEDICVEGFRITAEQLTDEYWRLKHMPVKKRLEKLAADRIAAYQRQYGQPPSAFARKEIKARIVKMFAFKDAFAMYREFYQAPERGGLFVTLPKSKLEFCDVFPLMYLVLMFEGAGQRYRDVKHLLIDEMQDYTPVQYAFLSAMFSCRMTILGDSHQSVNPYTSSSIKKISPYFTGCECVEIRKSYRSTIEIMNFVQGVRENQSIIPIERHGEKPMLTSCWNDQEELSLIESRIQEFRESSYNSLAILCKSQTQAAELYGKLKEHGEQIMLLDFDSNEFSDGVIITSCHMSKGLEFDCVIVPDCSAENYSTELDRSLLYIAGTRAMHKLELMFYGRQSAFVPIEAVLYQQA